MARPTRSTRNDGLEPHASDADAVDDLLAGGADPARPRSIQHFVLTDTQAAARTATLQLREAGFESTVTDNPTAAGWIVVAEHRSTIDLESIALTRSLMELIAGRLPGGAYDGWHAELFDDEDSFVPFDPFAD